MILILLIVGIVVALSMSAAARKRRLQEAIQVCVEQLSQVVSHHFLVQACTRCHESDMVLLDVSPNARSVHYQCRHCQKKLRGAAGSRDAEAAWATFSRLQGLLAEWSKAYPPVVALVQFSTPEAPLPFEVTTRAPIGEAVRTEVWRRDQGRCVTCGSNQHLEFDHIIPVARGGATSVGNLQLLCRGCNRKKAANI